VPPSYVDHDRRAVRVAKLGLRLDLGRPVVVCRLLPERSPDRARSRTGHERRPRRRALLPRHDVESICEHEPLVGASAEDGGRPLACGRVAGPGGSHERPGLPASCLQLSIVHRHGSSRAPSGSARWGVEGRRWRSGCGRADEVGDPARGPDAPSRAARLYHPSARRSEERRVGRRGVRDEARERGDPSSRTPGRPRRSSRERPRRRPRRACWPVSDAIGTTPTLWIAAGRDVDVVGGDPGAAVGLGHSCRGRCAGLTSIRPR
jgi:hypothetical protein